MTKTFFNSSRLERENRTVQKMIELYCHHHHRNGLKGCCSKCRELQDFAERRLSRCIYGPEKPVCAKCPVHCYKPAQREQIRIIMRWAGPRMLLHSPVLAIRHLLDERRPVPPWPGKKSRKKKEEYTP
ncbi:nitrous oxide-stimulated promoter family protein [Sansalvadorimonas sp. 2012CJ34-2]|uniref:Nitrous oxide-stimulated promoter family protein n=1 Tax=Parendozoicomonas callyspongiae TaxID=2942213 RepID=A0ABT0PKF8_9GAMM|nr:nitrous oxide-stimulated promoter family protein [Sansalvadorimonas sp. 2012CJ34-2]MCL6271844.1 nitrous oxide-stimulated promoter family protein [Sansalvadorimonas sp. 2012CJ34-2]